MAKKAAKRKGLTEDIAGLAKVGAITVARTLLQSQDIKAWQNAVNSARSVQLPRRRLLHELYDNLKLDGHLHSVLQTRTVGITNKRLCWVASGAPENEDDAPVMNSVINTPWFHQLLEHAMSAVPYGTTILELVLKAGEVGEVKVFPRANVVPEKSLLLMDVNDYDKGINYVEDPYWKRFLIQAGNTEDYGAMMVASPYVIYKRGGFASWAQFAELFGMPLRVGKYNQYDEDTRQKLTEALANMGGAGYIVLPDGASLEFVKGESSGTGGGDVYDKMVERCNAEMSKIFLGQTMTTDAGNKGARSLGEVHMQTQEAIALADMRRMEFLLNWQVKPRLLDLGYPVRDGDFRFVDTTVLSLDKRILIDQQVARQVNVPAEYWYKTYGIPMPTDGDTKPKRQSDAPDPEPEPTPEPPEDPDPARERDGMSAALGRLYFGGHHRTTAEGGAAFDDLARDPIWQAIVEGIHNGRIKPGDVDEDLMNWTASELVKAVLPSGEAGDDDEDQVQSDELRAWMKRNVFVFSGFKTYQTLRAASDQLLDEDGQMRPFSDFKKRVMAIDAEYNVRYLKAEYQQAVASAQSAEAWRDAMASKDDFPYAQIDTAGDDRVRPSHADLDGVRKHLDDPFWDTHWTPLDWGCRCDISVHADMDGGRELDTTDLPPRVGMFANNVGKNGVVFPKDHPYYRAPASVAKKVKKAVEKRLGPEPTKAPQPEPARQDGTTPTGTPVSASLTTTNRALKRTHGVVLKAIDQVHGDGSLTALELGGKPRKGSYGTFSSERFGQKAVAINVGARGPYPLNTLAHEIGHWLDLEGIGEKGWGTAQPLMAEVMRALRESAAGKQLRKVLDTGTLTDTAGNERPLHPLMYDHLEYLLSGKELWARAYAQYVAVRSKDAAMLKELNAMREMEDHKLLLKQWSDDDFTAVAEAIDKLFTSIGWQQKQ